ncbi:MAG: hypothetical protein IH588_12510 [Anaerolineales bacterium]|nr:hypothetical protein [Anaerolineales bacterium]
MAKKTSQVSNDEIFIESAPLSPEDERLDKLFDEMETGSLKTLEDAARQIITLSTTLLGAFFGLLAFKDAPTYLGFFDVKVIGTLALISFMAALYFALQAVSPKRYTFSHANLTAKRKILEELLTHKHGMVNRASWIFGFGAFLMLVAALDILFRI